MTSDEQFASFLTALDPDAVQLERATNLTDLELRMLWRARA